MSRQTIDQIIELLNTLEPKEVEAVKEEAPTEVIKPQYDGIVELVDALGAKLAEAEEAYGDLEDLLFTLSPESYSDEEDEVEEAVSTPAPVEPEVPVEPSAIGQPEQVDQVGAVVEQPVGEVPASEGVDTKVTQSEPLPTEVVSGAATEEVQLEEGTPVV